MEVRVADYEDALLLGAERDSITPDEARLLPRHYEKPSQDNLDWSDVNQGDLVGVYL